MDGDNQYRDYSTQLRNQEQILSDISRRDLRQIATHMDEVQARFYVRRYYDMQRDRIRFNNQLRTLGDKPNLLLTAFADISTKQEDLLKKTLDDYSADHPVGTWLRTVRGIGPVIAAGFIAHIDAGRLCTAGSLWRYAGLDPTQPQKKKGTTLSYNAELKKLCFKAGESFIKTKGHEKGFYGHLYEEKKEYYARKNLAGEFSEAAAHILRTKNWSKGTVTRTALEAGRLSDGHIHAMARRFCVKIFLSHLFEVYCITVKGVKPPAPFALAILGHAHRIEIPNTGSIVAFADPVGDDLIVPRDEERPEQDEESDGHGDDVDDVMSNRAPKKKPRK